MLKTLSNLKYTLTSPFLDIGKLENSILLIGMGRSGTTWAANIINHDHSYRVLFEPLFPALVREAKDFEYIQYIPVYDSNPRLRKKAASILAGKPRNRWVDRDNSGLLYRRRIIKDIRCNLMAGWLKKMFPHLPIVLLIRHPLQVAASWRKLGWGKEALGQRSDFDIITSQHRLIQDFPLLQSIVEQIDPNNFLDNVIFLWGVYHLIPFQQLHPDEVYYLYYEKLLTQPENECKNLFKYLNKPFSWKLVQNTLIHESSTNFQKRDFSKEHDQLLNGWKNIFSEGEIQRAKEILTMFGLDSIFQ